MTTIKSPVGVAEGDHNSMLYWYPKIEGKVPTPKTVIVPLKGFTTKWMDEGFPEPLLRELKAVSGLFGYPVFMRTEELSNKHEWNRSCFLQSEDDLASHLYNLIEMQEMAMWSDVRAIIFRQFLHLKSFFKAYSGMPVAREFRFFATKGTINCYHPYWPHAALEQGNPTTPNWRNYLKQLEGPPPKEARAIVEKASGLFNEQMSLDICELEAGGWMLTDMATGKESYHWQHGTEDGGRED